MWILDSIVQWLHLAAAVLLVGGLFFALYVMTPVLRREAGDRGRDLAFAVLQRFRAVTWIGVAALLLSGVYNFLRAYAAGNFDVPAYRHTLELKVLLALMVFVIAIGLTIPGATFFSSRRRFFVAFNIHLGLLLVLLSAVLRRYVG